VTGFGRRVLRKWVCFPLGNLPGHLERIQERQDCVEDLLNNYDAVNRFQQRGKKFCDVERLLTKVYTYSVRSVNDNSDVYVASSWNLKLTLFKKLLNHLT
jgi:DNA mismatch repair ATPase MutS